MPRALPALSAPPALPNGRPKRGTATRAGKRSWCPIRCACMVSAAHGGMDERRARPIIRGTVVLLLCAERGGLARASSLLAGTVLFSLWFLLLYSFARFLFIRLIKERPALILRLAADDDLSCVPSAGKPACMQLGGRPFPSLHHRRDRQTTRECRYRVRPCSVGESLHQGTKCAGPPSTKMHVTIVSPKYTLYYVRTLIHKNDARLRFPTRNACRRICRRVRSDPRRHAHTMLHGSFPRHLTGRSMPSGID